MPAPDTQSGSIKVTKRHPLIGAEVRGIDLSEPLASSTYEQLHQLWMEHLLLIFPDQPITDEQHITFGKKFGPLEFHPSFVHRSSRNKEIYRVTNTDEQGNITPTDDTSWQYLRQSWRWHTDSSFREVPSVGSILHGIEIVQDGGNTLFANMYAAYDQLAAETKDRIQDLWVIHEHDYIIRTAPELAEKEDPDEYEDLPPVRHPLVCIHPVTGRRSLFLSPHTMVNIDGMKATEGRTLLDELIAHATAGEFVYTHHWQPHDILMWDNRCTMHSVEPFDNVNLRRLMHRVTLSGELKPIPAVR